MSRLRLAKLHLELLDLVYELFLLGEENLDVLLLLGDHLDQEHGVLHLLGVLRGCRALMLLQGGN